MVTQGLSIGQAKACLDLLAQAPGTFVPDRQLVWLTLALPRELDQTLLDCLTLRSRSSPARVC